jgi:hypothetical protein
MCGTEWDRSAAGSGLPFLIMRKATFSIAAPPAKKWRCVLGFFVIFGGMLSFLLTTS